MKYLPFVLAPLAMPFAAQAANDTKPLNEIVITASRGAQTAGVDNAYVQVISNDEIKSSGAQTILDVLRQVAVIQVVDQTGDGSSPQIGMRGFGSNGSQNTLILLDGRRFNNETDLGTVNLRNLSLDDIERIEIVNGSSGALYGAGAVGGIVNIISKRVDGNRLEFSISRGSYDTEKYKARATARQGAWSMIISGDKDLSDNYRDNNALNSRFGQAKLAYDDSKINSFLELSTLKQTNGLAGSLSDVQLAQNRRQTLKPQDNSAIDGTRISAGTGVKINDRWQASIDGSIRKDEIAAEFYDPSGNYFLSQQREQFTLSPRLQGTLGTVGVLLGQDIEHGRYEMTDNYGSRNVGKPRTRSSYLQISIPVSSTVEVTTGYRYGQHRNDISFSSKVRDSVNAGSLGVFWNATDSLKTWLRADQNFRFATIEEHTSNAPFPMPSQPLKTQTGISYEGGLEKQMAAHKLRLQAYQLDLKNEITFAPTAFLCCNTNLDPTRRRGVNASLDTKLSPKLAASIQFGLVNGKFTAGPAQGRQIPHVPRTSLTTALTYKPLEKTSLALETQFTGSKFADSDFNNSNKVKAVLVNNLAISQQWADFTVSVRINNLLNEKYDLYTVESGAGVKAHYPAAERNALLTLAYSLK